MTISVIYDNDVYLDPILTSVTWSGDITQAYRSLSIGLTNTIDGKMQAVPIEIGRELRLLSDDTEVFRGIIFNHSVNARGIMNATAYDENVYLTKNSDTRKFSGLTADSIIRQLCADFGIDIGQIAETGYVIPKLTLRDKTLWDMITIALTETRKQTGRRFLLSAKEGALQLTERGEKVADFALEDTTNILDASYSQSIEELRTQVKVFGGDEEKSPISAIAKDDELIARFGLMQHIERADSDLKHSQIAQMAAKLLDDLGKIRDEASIEAIGNVEITAGTAVYVREALTQIIGGFYVITDSHSWSNGTHRMSLTISGDESLPRLEYEDPEADAKKKKGAAKPDVYDRIINSTGVGG